MVKFRLPDGPWRGSAVTVAAALMPETAESRCWSSRKKRACDSGLE
jgi:hypothetical protein